MLCVCKCKREVMDEKNFNAWCNGKHCPDCGDKYSLIRQPEIGVKIRIGGPGYENNYEHWMPLKELKKFLDEEISK